MVPYDASASVPMIIYDGRPGRQTTSPMTNVDMPTQLIDIFPTILELAQVDKSEWPDVLDGFSLVPMMPGAPGSVLGESEAAKQLVRSGEKKAAATHPDYVISQFSGDDIAMSWFLIVKHLDPTHVYKLIIWGTGAEVPSLLFELVSDPSENNNLIATPAGATANKALVDSLTVELKAVVDYPKVALAVAQYGVDSFQGWTKSTKDWEDSIHAKGLRWSDSWNADSKGSFAALYKYMNASAKGGAKVQPCRLALKWDAPKEDA